MPPRPFARALPALAAAAILIPRGAVAGEFLQTQLTLYFGDDNVLAGAEDGSPDVGLTNAYPELFFDGLNARKNIAVTETNLVAYKKLPGFVKNSFTEAALALNVEFYRDPDDGKPAIRIEDNGSYLRPVWYFSEADMEKGKGGRNFAITAFPFDSDRFRLGYTYDLSWGGKRMFTKNTDPVPGVSLQLDLGPFRAFAGFKTALGLRSDVNMPDTQYGVLAGVRGQFGGQDPAKVGVAVDAGFGWFDRGRFEDPSFDDTTIYAWGTCAQVSVFRGGDIGTSVDFRLFREDPAQAQSWLYPVKYSKGVHFWFGSEFNLLRQTLIDVDHANSTTWQSAIAADANLKLRVDKMRVNLDVVYRDAAFLLFNTPSLYPFHSFGEDSKTSSQLYFAVNVDYFVEKAHWTPGVIFGVMLPASYLGPSYEEGGIPSLVIIRGENDLDILPSERQDPFTVLSVKTTHKVELSPMMAIMGEVSWTTDYNRSKIVAGGEDPSGAVRVLDETVANALGLNLLLQARF
ncbi:hypothetical protein L6R50_00435 [Myxococcota bacterium]|nr:hypothetical protein [Myxococcota bacterium]